MHQYCIFIGNLDIFPLISLSDLVCIKELTMILTNISQCDVKYIYTIIDLFCENELLRAMSYQRAKPEI